MTSKLLDLPVGSKLLRLLVMDGILRTTNKVKKRDDARKRRAK